MFECLQLLRQFSLYSELINRPLIKEKLTSERQKLFVALHEYIKQLQSQSAAEVITNPMSQKDSETIKEIMKIRQLEQKAEDVRKISTKLLNDLPNYENFEFMLKEIIDDFKYQNNELFESWCNTILVSIKNNTLRYTFLCKYFVCNNH